jgi:hypothetical protein
VEERRGAVRRAPGAAALTARRPGRPARLGAGLLAASLVAASPGVTAERCETPTGFAAQGRLSGQGVELVFRTVPAPIEVGRHFAIEAIVCATPPPQGLRVDAQMPEHRHGMNYRTTVTATGAGRYRADGLLFHMPGRWQLVFDVDRGGRTDRLTTDVVLE